MRAVPLPRRLLGFRLKALDPIKVLLFVLVLTSSLAGFSTARFLWRVYGYLRPADLETSVRAISPSSRKAEGSPGRTLSVKENVFGALGEPSQTPAPPSARQEAVVAASLGDLKLLGVVESSANLALLSVKGNPAFVVEGDSVGSYKVSRITRDFVELLQGDKTYRLFLDFGAIRREKGLLETSASALLPSSGGGQASGGGPSSPSGESASSAGAGSGGGGVVSRSLIDQMLANPYELMSAVRITPYVKDGNPVGFQVRHLKRDNVLAQLGVKNGDVIKSINGIPIRNVGDVMNTIQSLMNSPSISVEVERGGSTINLSYEIR